MKVLFDVEYYKELLEKEKKYERDPTIVSPIFLELISYGAKVDRQISYERKEEYYSLISNYMNKQMTSGEFQRALREMEKQDSETSRIILNDLEKLGTFVIDLENTKFTDILGKISDVCDLIWLYSPEEGIGITEEKFQKNMTKFYAEMQELFEE